MRADVLHVSASLTGGPFPACVALRSNVVYAQNLHAHNLQEPTLPPYPPAQTYYMRPLLSEAGLVLKVAAATVGWDDAAAVLPALVVPPLIVTFLQGSILLAGSATSLVLTTQLGGGPKRLLAVWPHSLLLAAMTAELWYLQGL